MGKWKQVWNRDKRINNIIIEMLIKADGFDGETGSFTVDEWLAYIDELYQKMNIMGNESLYDIGCGSGAFIYPFFLKEHKVGGVDYSSVLINLAKIIMPNSDLEDLEATDIDTLNKYDIVLSHSVFHYFMDLEYAKRVIKSMIDKSNNKIAIFDINDKSKEKEYHKIRMSGIDEDEYKERYKDLDHMFYDKSWFEDIAKEFNLKIDIFDQTFGNYSNSKLRFNVIMEKV